MKILVIIPVVGTHFNQQIAEHIKTIQKDNVNFDIVNLEQGSTFIATDAQRSEATKKWLLFAKTYHQLLIRLFLYAPLQA